MAVTSCAPRWIAILLFIAGLTCSAAVADDELNLDYHNTLKNYKQIRWSAAQGMPVNTLLEIAQTSDGYLWISSFDGLMKFDGISFQLFSRKILEIINNNVCKALALDAHDRLWVGTHGSGVFSLENGEFIPYAQEQDFRHHVNKLFFDSRGNLWLGSISHGLYKVADDKIIPQLEDSWIANQSISSFAETDQGGLWIATEGEGLLKWEVDNKIRYSVSNGLPSNLIFVLFRDSQGIIWVGTDRGTAQIIDNKVIMVEETRGLVCRAITEDREGDIWLGFDSGLSRYCRETRKFEILGEDNNFGHLSTKDIMVDREDNIWIATKFGELIQLRSSNFTQLNSAFGVRGKTIYCVTPINNEEIYLASNEGYIDRVGKGDIKPHYLDKELLGKRIRHVMQDSRSRVWYSTYSGLLLEEADGKLRWFTRSKGFPDNRIRISFEDSQGTIWVGTRGDGLLRMNEDMTWEAVSPQGKLDGSLIMSINEDREGNIWVGTSGDGVVVFKDEKLVSHLHARNGFVSDIVFNTYIDEDNVAWVAANGGIARISKGEIAIYNTDNGLFSDSIYDIVEDSRGELWIPCNVGLMKVRKSEFKSENGVSKNLVSCRLFGQNDGIQSPFTATSKAYIDSRGVIWLPTFNGVIYADTRNFVENSHKPICHITEINIDNEIVRDYDNVVIAPGEKRIRFEYTALSLAAPRGVRFKTMLQGYDNGWSEVNSDRSASFTNLAPGDYTFVVIASNNDGVWGDPVSCDISVVPALWQQGWFVVLMISLLVFALFGLEQLRVNAIKVREKKLTVQVAERTAEIKESNELLAAQTDKLKEKNLELNKQKKELKSMNRELESFTHVVSHDLRAPLNVMKGYLHLISDSEKGNMGSENYRFLEKTSQQIKRMNSMISSLLELSKASRQEIVRDQVNLSLIAKDTIAAFARSEPERNYDFNCADGIKANCDETLTRIVLQNLLNNAWKYSAKVEKSIIEFGSTEKAGENVLYVKDNGAGFPQEKAAELFTEFKRLHTSSEYEGIGIGLNSVKRIIDRHGGRIWAEAKVGKGATFFFTLG